jgi:hypothetical protein
MFLASTLSPIHRGIPPLSVPSGPAVVEVMQLVSYSTHLIPPLLSWFIHFPRKLAFPGLMLPKIYISAIFSVMPKNPGFKVNYFIEQSHD